MIGFHDTGREHRVLSVFTLAFSQRREQGAQTPLGHQPDFSQSKMLCTSNTETIRPAQEATVLTHMLCGMWLVRISMQRPKYTLSGEK